VLLLAMRPDEKSGMMNSFSLFIRDRGKDEDKGTIVPLPEESSGSSPQLELHDFDGDHVEDALVTASTGDGHIRAWILSVKGKKDTLLFDSAKSVMPTPASGYTALAAADTNNDGVYELDIAGIGNAAENANAAHAVLRWQNGTWKNVAK
jgi:hypothetical protein